MDAAVAVVEAVDRGVVLVVAAQGLQQQPAPGGLAASSSGLTVNLALPVAVGKRALVARPCGSAKPPGAGDARVEVVEAGDDARDAVADRP